MVDEATLRRRGWIRQRWDDGRASLSVLASGEPGEPTLVFLHGFSDGAICWLPVADRLADEHAMRLVDLHGHGGSGLPAGGLRCGWVAEDLVAGVRTIGPVGLIGHSLGANVALVAAGLAPDLVTGLVLEDPPWPDDPDDTTDATADFQRWLLDLRDLDEASRRQRGADEHRSWPEAELAPWAVSKAQVDLRIFDTPIQWLPGRWPDLLRRVTAPTLLLTGDRDRGAIVAAASAARARRLNDQVEVQHVAGAGHSIRRDAPEVVQRAIRTFLANLAFRATAG